MSSEDGWEPAKASPDQCEWITVRGTESYDDPVRLQLLKGQPRIIMGAYAADYNAYVEKLRNNDSAGWTPTNSVATSNHLNGTAMDLNWDSHPFRVADAGYSPQMIATMNEMLDFYEDTMFWANRWDNPKDAMHHQMGYDTYGSQNVARVQDFIRRKIRSDGFSTFRREGVPLPPPPPLSRTDRYALAVIGEGKRRNISPKGIQIALCVPFAESGWKIYANSNVPESLNYPHDAVGSDHDSNGLFQQRMAWGPLSVTMDPAGSAGLFYDGGQAGQRGLTDFDYNSNARTPGGWAQAVQVSAFPDRYDAHWNEAVDMYNRLAGQQPPPPPGPTGDDELSAEAERMIAVIYQEITKKFPSRSPLRHLDEGVVDTWAGFTLNVDSSVHVEIVKTLASLGHRPSLALLWDVANADPARYPDRQSDREIAKMILADAKAKPANSTAPADDSSELAAAYAEISRLRYENSHLQQQLQQQSAPAATVSTELAAVEPKAPTLGQSVGGKVDADQEWAKVALALDKVQQHALDVSIQGLKMQTNGAEQ